MIEVSIIDALRIELLKISGVSPKGAHFEVARRMNITPDSELKIRKGMLCKKDVASNHQKLRQIIKLYEIVNQELNGKPNKSNTDSETKEPEKLDALGGHVKT